jgi:transcriptional regulator with XRE-family HTH domain
VDLAKRLKRSQSYVTYVETGQKLVDVVELMEWAEAIGFDARDALKRLAKGVSRRRNPPSFALGGLRSANPPYALQT